MDLRLGVVHRSQLHKGAKKSDYIPKLDQHHHPRTGKKNKGRKAKTPFVNTKCPEPKRVGGDLRNQQNYADVQYQGEWRIGPRAVSRRLNVDELFPAHSVVRFPNELYFRVSRTRCRAAQSI